MILFEIRPPQPPVLQMVGIYWREEKPSEAEIEAWCTLFPEIASLLPFTEIKRELSTLKRFETMLPSQGEAEDFVRRAQALGLDAKLEWTR